MKYNLKKYRSALILQIILAHIHAIHSAHLIPKDILQYRRSMVNNKMIGSTKYGVNYYAQDPQVEDGKPNLLSRETKSDNKPRIFNIDLSQLRQNTPILHSTTEHKSPTNLLSIDISALSKSPDPSFPIATMQSKDKVNGKFIMAYAFDPRFDRLPVNKANLIRTYALMHGIKGKALLPMMNLPLKAMTAYRSNFANKKHDTDFEIDDGSTTTEENEQKYTANFILQLLYQLSSNFKNVSHN